MIKEKIKYSVLMLLFCCIGWAMTGCNDDDEPTPEDASFGRVKAVLSIKAEGETTQCFDVTGEWKCNGETMAMAPLKLSADQTYMLGDSKTLPATYAMTLNVVPNKDFVPEQGKKYRAKITFKYDIKVEDTKGETLVEKEGVEYVMNMSFNGENLAELAERFPVTYVFTVKKTANGKYEITDDVI